jgi:hypothetical protein
MNAITPWLISKALNSAFLRDLILDLTSVKVGKQAFRRATPRITNNKTTLKTVCPLAIPPLMEYCKSTKKVLSTHREYQAERNLSAVMA